MCSCDDASTPVSIDTRLVKGRKLHYCCECLASIVKGELHEVTSGMWADGNEVSFGCYRTCLLCVSWRDALTAPSMAANNGFACVPPFGELIECLMEEEGYRR